MHWCISLLSRNIFITLYSFFGNILYPIPASSFSSSRCSSSPKEATLVVAAVVVSCCSSSEAGAWHTAAGASVCVALMASSPVQALPSVSKTKHHLILNHEQWKLRPPWYTLEKRESKLLMLRGLRLLLEEHLISVLTTCSENPVDTSPSGYKTSLSFLKEGPTSVGIQLAQQMPSVLWKELPHERWAMGRGLWKKAIPSLHEQSPWCSTFPGWSDLSELCQALWTTRCLPAMLEEGKAAHIPYQASGF